MSAATRKRPGGSAPPAPPRQPLRRPGPPPRLAEGLEILVCCVRASPERGLRFANSVPLFDGLQSSGEEMWTCSVSLSDRMGKSLPAFAVCLLMGQLSLSSGACHPAAPRAGDRAFNSVALLTSAFTSRCTSLGFPPQALFPGTKATALTGLCFEWRHFPLSPFSYISSSIS